MWARGRKLFELIDDNQSGTVEKVEIAAVHGTDPNDNPNLIPSLSALILPSLTVFTPTLGADLFTAMDENDDGVVTPEEWDHYFQYRLALTLILTLTLTLSP